jgi:hypothetical protein
VGNLKKWENVDKAIILYLIPFAIEDFFFNCADDN